MRYRFIRDHRGQFPLTRLCRVLQIPRSGFYAWGQRPESAHAQEDRRRLTHIQAISQASRRTYGSPRVHAALRQHGETCGRHRVSPLMRAYGLAALHRRRCRVTTAAGHRFPVAENVLARQFQPAAPNQVWVSDLTYVPTHEGWLYLSTVMDLASRRIVGWAMDTALDSTLALRALHAALQARRPKSGLIHHSDRGRQYASNAYQAVLTQHGVIPSMSRRGNCWDNAPMESFFHSLKVEWLHGTTFRTRAAARQAIFTFIEIWYNRQRLHAALGYQAPIASEQGLVA